MIPLSTAMWDPKWFHEGKNQNHKFLDHNGVWNGFRANDLILPYDKFKSVQGSGCVCGTQCKMSPQDCLYMKTYYQHLLTINFDSMIKKYEQKIKELQKVHDFYEEPIIILIVHEAPSCRCSERNVLQKWFAENGVQLLEWRKS